MFRLPDNWTIDFQVNQNTLSSQPILTIKGEDGSDCFVVRTGGDERQTCSGIVVELYTDYHPSPLRLLAQAGVPKLSNDGYRTAVIRYSGSVVDLIIDGEIVDQEWPYGRMGGESGFVTIEAAVEFCFHSYAMTDDELTELFGVAGIDPQRGMVTVRQYWRPPGVNVFAGDCMPFYHDGHFHLFYLYDRHHHGSKWGKGAHQWAHISTDDLRVWQSHPLAVAITDPSEGSICTGSVFHKDQVFYAFYSVRTMDNSPAPLMVSTSLDCVSFEKQGVVAQLSEPYEAAPVRDPVLFRGNDSLYHMLVTTQLIDSPTGTHKGCLAHLTSADFVSWEQHQPFLIPGYSGSPDWASQPECPDIFFWRGWFYLTFGIGGVTHYLMAKDPMGPWQRPRRDTFDGVKARVFKFAAYDGDRRIGTAFLEESGYGGDVVFRELVQHRDGTLGTAFVPELAREGELWTTPTSETSDIDSGEIVVSGVQGFACRKIAGIPKNVRIRLTATPGEDAAAFGIAFAEGTDYDSGYELRMEPHREKVGWREPSAATWRELEEEAIFQVSGLGGPLELEVIKWNDILDVCIVTAEDSRTLVIRKPSESSWDTLYLFAQWGHVAFSNFCIMSLAESSGEVHS